MEKYNINELLNSVEEARGRYVTEYNKALSENKHHKCAYIDEQIQNLEQVENILEAWEVVRPLIYKRKRGEERFIEVVNGAYHKDDKPYEIIEKVLDIGEKGGNNV